jgi:hypothetical protein
MLVMKAAPLMKSISRILMDFNCMKQCPLLCSDIPFSVFLIFSLYISLRKHKILCVFEHF